ncbi:hypothetical protein L3X38_025866 [Prunus dulcis]|uniref:Uncharacterized protein n=1 Tax=Prunus dulcis TaxID=3755 RepID=A0AAD4W586_PRUDU|nr:hypothetical protein L3X38_025866 [Prunus dulcis]
MVFRSPPGGPRVEVGQVLTARGRRSRRYPCLRSTWPVVARPWCRRRRVALLGSDSSLLRVYELVSPRSTQWRLGDTIFIRASILTGQAAILAGLGDTTYIQASILEGRAAILAALEDTTSIRAAILTGLGDTCSIRAAILAGRAQNTWSIIYK